MEPIYTFFASNWICFVIATVLSVFFYPFVRLLGIKIGAYAKINNRTIHKKKIVRVGGISIFLSAMISFAIFLKFDARFLGIFCGGIVVFFIGLLDDIYDISPKLKFLGQLIASAIAIFISGVTLDHILLPFGIYIDFGVLNVAVTFFWLIGITNAINLIDGLDGLAGGVTSIGLSAIMILMLLYGYPEIDSIFSFILVGSIFGFLIFNFYPAKIFMGDCGALFIGFNIACLSILSIKTATFVTLLLPIVLLFIPISDTLIAILRRQLKGVSFSIGDREHLHHILMDKLKLGHLKTVLVIYAVTFVFSIDAILLYFSRTLGFCLFFVLLLIYDIFIEKTGMINPKYRPLLTIQDRVIAFWQRNFRHQDN